MGPWGAPHRFTRARRSTTTRTRTHAHVKHARAQTLEALPMWAAQGIAALSSAGEARPPSLRSRFIQRCRRGKHPTCPLWRLRRPCPERRLIGTCRV
eukprot:3672185-Pyramimonas_sp.AAC.1